MHGFENLQMWLACSEIIYFLQPHEMHNEFNDYVIGNAECMNNLEHQQWNADGIYTY